MKPLTTLLISGEWRRTYDRLWKKERTAKWSNEKNIAPQRTENSLNEFISRERERIFPEEENKTPNSLVLFTYMSARFARDSTAMKTSPTSKCLSRSIQKHLVAFLYYQRGTKRATVCYCTQSEGPLLLNLMKWNWKVQLRSSTRKRSSEVSHRRKTQKPNFATEESRKDESRPWNDSRKTKDSRPAQSYSSRWLISMSRITLNAVSIGKLISQNLKFGHFFLMLLYVESD